MHGPPLLPYRPLTRPVPLLPCPLSPPPPLPAPFTRAQDMLRLQMALAYKTGDTAKAKAIQARLEPEEPGKKK